MGFFFLFYKKFHLLEEGTTQQQQKFLFTLTHGVSELERDGNKKKRHKNTIIMDQNSYFFLPEPFVSEKKKFEKMKNNEKKEQN